MSVNRRGRVRAMRAQEPEEAIAARVAALRPFLGRTREERQTALGRLLRKERRAARCGVGYDALRHAALRRLLTEAQMPSDKPGRAKPVKGPGAS